MPNANDKIASFLTRHDINLMRVDASTRKEVIGLIRNLYSTLTRHVRRIDMTSPVRAIHRENRFGVLIEAAGESIDEVYGQISRLMDARLGDLAIFEQTNLVQTFNDALRVEMLTPTLSASVLKELSRKTLIHGDNSRGWWKELDRQFKGRFRRQMREGLLLTEPLPSLIKRVGIIRGLAERHAKTIVRTSAQAVLQNARYATYKEHPNVIKGQQWLSTLDSRTSDTCKALDGQAWFLDGRRMKGTTIAWQGPPPAHFNCRSTLVPVTKSWDELTKNPKIKKKLKRLTGKRAQGTRASLNGQVARTNNYESWLKSQDEKFQRKALGGTPIRDGRRIVDYTESSRYRLWKKGKIGLTDLIDQTQNPLSLNDLKELVATRSRAASIAGRVKGTRYKNSGSWYDAFADKKVTANTLLRDLTDTEIKALEKFAGDAKKLTTTDKLYYRGGKWASSRVSIHNKIIKHFLSPEKVKAATPLRGKTPNYVMFGGRGGSGKGAFTGSLNVVDRNKYIVLDADEIKQMLPEYQGWNAFQLHEESSYIFEEITRRAQQMGLNIVHDMTLKTASTAINRAKQFIDLGYEIDGYYMFLPPQVSAQRAVSRALGPTQRYVPIDVILSNTENERTFDRLKRYFSNWQFWDNQGNAPVMVASS